VGAAFVWGVLAASSLVIGSVVALLVSIPERVVGLILGFGAGVLISAVAFDLVEEAASKSSGHGAAIAGLFVGCGVFFAGDWFIDRAGGADRKDANGGQESGSGLAIVLGTILDGIPESMVIGLTIFEGGAVGAAYLAAVFISNLPESISSTSGLVTAGWKKCGCGSRSPSSRGSRPSPGTPSSSTRRPTRSRSCSPSPRARSSRCWRTR